MGKKNATKECHAFKNLGTTGLENMSSAYCLKGLFSRDPRGMGE